MEMSEYKEIFKVESEEHLQQLNEALLGLEQNPNEMEYINNMFRSAHTLKGMSATMGFNTIAELTHEMENIMDMIRKSQISLTEKIIEIQFECLDTLEMLVENIDDPDAVDVSTLQCKLHSITIPPSNVQDTMTVPAPVTKLMDPAPAKNIDNGIPASQSTNITEPLPCKEVMSKEIEFTREELAEIQHARSNDQEVFTIKVLLDESCVLKAARSSMVLMNLDKVGKIIKTKPSEKEIEDEKFDFSFVVVAATSESMGSIQQMIENISEVKKVELMILYPQEETTDAHTEDITKGKNVDPTNKNTIQQKKNESLKTGQSIRVNIERLDNLMNLVGELIINKIRLNQLATSIKSKDLEEALGTLDRLTNEIQTEVMGSRMVPIDQIFSRFPRMIRDLAKSEGKQINLMIEGKEIELDRTVLDEIGDPLVHLLRNAVDHGIESPQERAKAGKSPEGLVRLAASRQRNTVLIEVQDDGKGMDPSKLRDAAVKKGLMSKEEVSKLSDEEALNLIFLPGFSTNSVITDVSGRGVGMDVAKTKIESLGGNVSVRSVLGEGSIVTLQLPLTIAIIQSLMIKTAGETYAIPLNNVVRDVGIRSKDIKTIEGQEVILLRGEVLPLLRLNSILDCPVEVDDKENLIVVVVEKMGNHFGFVVDELLGQQEVIIKSLDSKVLRSVKGFAGATILGDGTVCLILDIGTLV
ncbi:chemotaxis protein CheA [uncultured Methanomethylovorans sp.]|uniref:chemotaxis protein CheA n=1 Tax=uncultured Methanomethylovorans sp. TaxID=183759 RepID=UPI002619127C|nr:chemotaxis protein CheA [uncultured Methanomethylovorans sp.]